MSITGVLNGNGAISGIVASGGGFGLRQQVVTFVKPSDVVFSQGGTRTLTASATSLLPVTFASTTTGVCTTGGTNGATVTYVSAGTCSITASQAGNSNYAAAADVSQSFTIGQATQTISFAKPSDVVFTPGGTRTLTATGGASGLPVTFASTTTGVCTTGGTNGATVTYVSAGTCAITASQAGNTNYAAATTVSQSFAIGQATQAISFAKPADQVYGTGKTITLAATGGASGNPVVFTSGSVLVCTVSGNTVSLLAPGSCSISANQAGNANYAAAPVVVRTFAVTQIKTTTALVSSNPSPMMGAAVTFTATVTQETSGSGANVAAQAFAVLASGTVTFTSNGTVLCGNVPLANAQASCTTAFNTPGHYAVTAQYSGGGGASSSTSSLVTQTVIDQRVKTVDTISKFVGQRNNQVLSNGPSEGRQIDRLMEAATGKRPATIAGLNSEATVPDQRTLGSSRLGDGPDATDNSRTRVASGQRSAQRDTLLPFGSTQGDGNPFPMQVPLGGIYANDNSPSGGAINIGVLRMTGSVEGASNFGFATSLRDLYRHGAELRARKTQGEAALGFGGVTGPAVASTYSPFDLWIEGKYASFRDRRASSDLDGHFGIVTIGADYVLSPKLLVGTVVQFDNMQQTSTNQATEASGAGWIAGPYATVRLSDSVFLQARAAWGQASNKVSPFMTYVDKFDSQRWLASATLSGRWTHGVWSFSPSASVSYIEDVTKSYADTFGAIIPSVKSQLGQAKLGPEISYKYMAGPYLVLEPRAGAQLIWNFAGSTSAEGIDTLGGETAGPSGARGRAELGVRATNSNGVSLDLSGSYDGVGANGYSATTGRVRLRVPLP